MSEPQERKRSPLHEAHLRHGARLTGFAGWGMPVQYAGILEEYHAVRGSCGVFDISHMGVFEVTGAGAVPWLDGLLTNRVPDLAVGVGHYTLLCNAEGGVIDDLILYRWEEGRFVMVVNAARTVEDRRWMEAHGSPGASLADRGDSLAAMAVQGPRAAEVWEKVAPDGCPLPARNGIGAVGDGFVCRTGYTGEDGFEVFVPAPEGPGWWERLVEAGAAPCGLGARDVLRLEMGYPLNGADLDAEHTPLEAGLGAFVDREGDFVGAGAMREQRSAGLPSRLAAFRMTTKSPPPRPGYPVEHGGETVGTVTSGGLSPGLGVGIGMAYLPPELARPGTGITIGVRGRAFPAETVKKPIYRKAG